MDKKLSLLILICLIVAFAMLSAINVLLLQGEAGAATPPATMTAPLPILALISAGIVLLLYGAIGLIGFFLARKIGLPELWDSRISNRQRFLIPALIGAAVGWGLLWLVRVIGGYVLKQEAMGWGDVKMLAMIGAFVGWRGVLLTVFLGALSGSLIFLPLQLMGKKRLVPFGVFLAVGGAVTFLFRDSILSWYTQFLHGA